MQVLAEARAFLDATPYSVCVLLDLHLPDTHGLGAVRMVRDAAPDAAVVVLTGVAENEAGLAAVAEGAQDFLAKDGLDAEALSRAVRYALQRKQVERSGAELQASRLLARENARLERGLLPTPCCGMPVARWPRATARDGTTPCSAATSSTSSRARTAPCTR